MSRTILRDWIKRQTGARCETIEGEDSALSPIQAECGRHPAVAQWFPATLVRWGLAYSPALVALFRSTMPQPAMRYERPRSYRTEVGASFQRRSDDCGELAGNMNAPDATTADRRHEFENVA